MNQNFFYKYKYTYYILIIMYNSTYVLDKTVVPDVLTLINSFIPNPITECRDLRTIFYEIELEKIDNEYCKLCQKRINNLNYALQRAYNLEHSMEIREDIADQYYNMNTTNFNFLMAFKPRINRKEIYETACKLNNHKIRLNKSILI